MFCEKCGAQNADNSAFCQNCGATLKRVQPPVNNVVPPVQQPVNNAVPPVQQPVNNVVPPVQQSVNNAVPPVQQPVNNTFPPSQPVRQMNNQNAYYGQPVAPVQPQAPKKGKGGMIAGIVAGAVVLLGLVGFGVSRLFSGDDGNTVPVASADPVPSVSVSISEPASVEPEPDPIEVEGPARRTVMVYMIGSNLESESGLASQDIDEMLKAESSDRFKIVLQTGGTRNWENPQMRDSEVQRFEIVDNQLVELKKMGKISMVEQEALTDFIEYSVELYPAEEYVLVMWNHGGSIPIGFGSDELFEGELTDVEIGQAIADSGVHIDSLIFNACEMCSLELFMALKDSVDYVVAAESVVYGYGLYGSGIDYTSWINLAINEEVSTQDYCEKILDDYVQFLKDINSMGSMSVIRMDRIQEVYDAYVDYITQAYSDMLYNDAYADFVIARENCGIYEGTDSVDISTLATKFENNYSTHLQNAVTNATVRTKSDLSYGHGITAYCPYNYANYYDEGRKSFLALGYDDAIISFYDLLASKILYYNGLTAYAGDWYVAQGDSSDSYGQEYELDYAEVDGNLVIALTDEDWDIVKSVKMYVSQYIDTRDLLYLYGSDVQYRTDDNGYILVARPKYWLWVNDYIPSSYCQWTTSDDEGWYDVYFVYAYVNGEEAFLRVDSTSENVQGSVTGYYLCDFETAAYDDGHIFNDYDEIQLAGRTYNMDGEEEIRYVGQPFYAKDVYTQFISLDYSDDEEVYIYYEITDVYENVYTTEIVTTSK